MVSSAILHPFMYSRVLRQTEGSGILVFVCEGKEVTIMSSTNRKQELAELHEQHQKKLLKQKRVEELTALELPKSWKVSEKGLEAIKVAVAMTQTKHGLYASIPMLCKAEECPYAKVCPLVDMEMAPRGERCPLEIAMILNKFEEYSKHFGVTEEDTVDLGLIRDLIDYDIQLFRADNKIAIEGDFVEDVVVTVTESGEVITNPQLSKATEYKEKIQAKRYKVLELMNSTRKDKAGSKLTVTLDPSTYAAQLMAQAAAQAKQGEVIDAEYEDMDSDE